MFLPVLAILVTAGLASPTGPKVAAPLEFWNRLHDVVQMEVKSDAVSDLLILSEDLMDADEAWEELERGIDRRQVPSSLIQTEKDQLVVEESAADDLWTQLIGPESKAGLSLEESMKRQLQGFVQDPNSEEAAYQEELKYEKESRGKKFSFIQEAMQKGSVAWGGQEFPLMAKGLAGVERMYRLLSTGDVPFKSPDEKSTVGAESLIQVVPEPMQTVDMSKIVLSEGLPKGMLGDKTSEDVPNGMLDDKTSEVVPKSTLEDKTSEDVPKSMHSGAMNFKVKASRTKISEASADFRKALKKWETASKNVLTLLMEESMRFDMGVRPEDLEKQLHNYASHAEAAQAELRGTTSDVSLLEQAQNRIVTAAVKQGSNALEKRKLSFQSDCGALQGEAQCWCTMDALCSHIEDGFCTLLADSTCMSSSPPVVSEV